MESELLITMQQIQITTMVYTKNAERIVFLVSQISLNLSTWEYISSLLLKNWPYLQWFLSPFELQTHNYAWSPHGDC